MLMELKNQDSYDAWGQRTHRFQAALPEPENHEANADHVVNGLAPGAINICPRWGHQKIIHEFEKGYDGMALKIPEATTSIGDKSFIYSCLRLT